MFTSRALRRLLPACPWRWVALLCAGLVGLLSLAAVSPDVHAALHGDYHDTDTAAKSREDAGHPLVPGHACVVTIFSQGMESGFPSVLRLAASLSLCPDVVVRADQVARSAWVGQLPPGCGPPAC